MKLLQILALLCATLLLSACPASMPPLMPRTLPADLLMPCPELVKPANASQGAWENAYAQAIVDYGICAGMVRGWQVWAKNELK